MAGVPRMGRYSLEPEHPLWSHRTVPLKGVGVSSGPCHSITIALFAHSSWCTQHWPSILAFGMGGF